MIRMLEEISEDGVKRRIVRTSSSTLRALDHPQRRISRSFRWDSDQGIPHSAVQIAGSLTRDEIRERIDQLSAEEGSE